MAKVNCKYQEYRVTGRRKDSGPHHGNRYGCWFCQLKKDERPFIGSGRCDFKDNEIKCPNFEPLPE